MNKKWKQRTAKALLAALFCTTMSSVSICAQSQDAGMKTQSYVITSNDSENKNGGY